MTAVSHSPLITARMFPFGTRTHTSSVSVLNSVVCDSFPASRYAQAEACSVFPSFLPSAGGRDGFAGL